MIIYTNETCPYCKQVKEELNKNNIKFKEKLTDDYEIEWTDVHNLTGIPTVPTIIYKDNYFIPCRDFRSAIHLVEVIKHTQDSCFSIEKQTIEKIKTLTYHIQTAFGRTDQLLRQIETKLNKEE